MWFLIFNVSFLKLSKKAKETQNELIESKSKVIKITFFKGKEKYVGGNS